MERDITVCVIGETNRISTHTLTWSVTELWEQVAHKLWISTHTLTWSVTARIGRAKRGRTISTHTLTWSVTLLSF